MNRRSRRQTA